MSTTQTIQAPKQAAANVHPEFIRLPKPGTLCPYTGLSRSKLNELILGSNPPVKSVCLRKRGARTGTRLISYDSLMSYLSSFMDEDNS